MTTEKATPEIAEPELEVAETDLEVIPRNETAVDVSRKSIEDMEWLANNIEKIVEYQKKIYMSLLKMTVPGDFSVFGEGEKERAELGTAGCERLAKVGVIVVGSKMIKEIGRDEHGEYFTYIATGKATFRGRSIDVMSCASSRDKFYGRQDGKIKDISNVSKTDVKKAAWRGLIKEAVKSLLGLRRLDPKELALYKIPLTRTGGHKFESKESQVAATDQVVTCIKEAKIDKQGTRADKSTWTLYKITGTEGDVFFTYEESEYKKCLDAIANKVTVGISSKKNKYNSLEITGLSLIPAAPLAAPAAAPK